KMTLENISPGDWDSSNNSAQNLVLAAAASSLSDKVVVGTITIVQPPPPPVQPPPPPVVVPAPTLNLSYSAQAADLKLTALTDAAQMYDSLGNLVFDYSTTNGQDGWQQYAQITFWRGAPAVFPLATATVVEKDDGAHFADSSLTNIAPDVNYPGDYSSTYSDGTTEYTQSHVTRMDSGFLYQISSLTK